MLLILLLTLGFAFGLRAGFYGLPIIVLLSSWFFKYAYVLLDSVANGRKETPVLSVEMLNPVDEQRPLAQVAICAGVFFAVRWVGDWVGGRAALVIAIVSLLYLPVSIAVLGVSARAVDAVNPAALTRTIVGLGPYYLLILGVVRSLRHAAGVRVHLGPSGRSARSGSACSDAVAVQLARRGAVRAAPRARATSRPIRRRGKPSGRIASARTIRAQALDEVYGEARGGNFIPPRPTRLLRWLREHDVRDCSSAMCASSSIRAGSWQDEKAFVFMSRFLISHLIEGGKTGMAVEIVDGVLQRRRC